MKENKFDEIHKKLSSITREKLCFINDSDCKGKIISAHSIQNNRILNNLSEDGYVLTIQHNLENNFINFKFDLKGRKIATTFYGFCKYHDSEIFKPIEEFSYTRDNNEQEFLFALRCIAKEFYIKKNKLNLEKYILDIITNNEEDKIRKYLSVDGSSLTNEHKSFFKHYYKSSYMGTSISFEELRNNRDILLKSLKRRDFNSIITYSLKWNMNFHLAVSSIFALEKDFNGNLINDLSDLSKEMHMLMLTIFPQENDTFVLISFLENHSNTYKFLETQFMNQTEFSQKNIVSQLILSYCENIVISPKQWRKFNKNKQEMILKLFNESIIDHPPEINIHKDTNLFI